ncbi:hypothetical protein FRC03_011681 [Tulasnella sp. 419]|nr:hypothetical protein FRC02_000323 [Tulasnella sp. 418]KAG8953751.1 hypothetical protein FRC03_011681 [Tulasnella sp. 419]
MEASSSNPGTSAINDLSNLITQGMSWRTVQSTYGNPNNLMLDDGRSVLFYVQATHSWKAIVDDEFSAEVGDVIAVFETPEGGWWRGTPLRKTSRIAGKETFPARYVALFVESHSTAIKEISEQPAFTNGRAFVEWIEKLMENRKAQAWRTQSGSNGEHILADGKHVLFYVRALYNRESSMPEELSFKEGDIVGVLELADSGWWKGVLMSSKSFDTSNQNVAEFPANYVELLDPAKFPTTDHRVRDHARDLMEKGRRWREGPIFLEDDRLDDGRRILFFVRALYDYTAHSPIEFNFCATDKIAVLKTSEYGWWEGLVFADQGKAKTKQFFPINFVEFWEEKWTI